MKGQNYSKKRQAIYDAMCSTDEHPSADWIYSKLKGEYPDLSLGTVYRNMRLMQSKNMIKPVAVVNGCERYDAKMTPHSHFVCNCCGKITDVFLGFDLIDRIKIDGGEVQSYNLVYYGLCAECKRS